MEKEFNLSERIVDDLRGGGQLGIRIDDVKEFIRLLKDWVFKMDFEEGYFCGEEGERMREQIDKLAGDKLKEDLKK